MGTSRATREMRFFSAASRLGSRLGLPSPTRTTPGLPTARCTTSRFLLAATAGVTVQPPRMLCRIAAGRAGLALDRRVLGGLREPAEEDQPRHQAGEHAER